jgi:hypothetical protein
VYSIVEIQYPDVETEEWNGSIGRGWSGPGAGQQPVPDLQSSRVSSMNMEIGWGSRKSPSKGPCLACRAAPAAERSRSKMRAGKITTRLRPLAHLRSLPPHPADLRTTLSGHLHSPPLNSDSAVLPLWLSGCQWLAPSLRLFGGPLITHCFCHPRALGKSDVGHRQPQPTRRTNAARDARRNTAKPTPVLWH